MAVRASTDGALFSLARPRPRPWWCRPAPSAPAPRPDNDGGWLSSGPRRRRGIPLGWNHTVPRRCSRILTDRVGKSGNTLTSDRTHRFSEASSPPGPQQGLLRLLLLWPQGRRAGRVRGPPGPRRPLGARRPSDDPPPGRGWSSYGGSAPPGQPRRPSRRGSRTRSAATPWSPPRRARGLAPEGRRTASERPQQAAPPHLSPPFPITQWSHTPVPAVAGHGHRFLLRRLLLRRPGVGAAGMATSSLDTLRVLRDSSKCCSSASPAD